MENLWRFYDIFICIFMEDCQHTLGYMDIVLMHSTTHVFFILLLRNCTSFKGAVQQWFAGDMCNMPGCKTFW